MNERIQGLVMAARAGRSTDPARDRAPFWALILLLLTAHLSGAAFAAEEAQVRRSTLFYASFDSGAIPDHAPNVSSMNGSTEPIPDGRFGGGLRAPERSHLVYTGGAAGLSPRAGTIECWIRARWPEASGRERPILALAFGKDRLVKLKRDAHGRFGFALARPDESGVRQVEHLRTEPGRLTMGAWHHVALSWSEGRAELWIDDMLVARKTGVDLPIRDGGDLRITGSDFDLDELRLSLRNRSQPGSIESTEEAWQDMVSPLRQTRWDFVEPIPANRMQGKRNRGRTGLGWRAKPLLADFDPRSDWPASPDSELRIEGPPGVTARAAFLIATDVDLPRVEITLTPHREKDEETRGWAATFSRVVRTLEREYWSGGPGELAEVGRFLTPWQTRSMKADEFSEVWLSFDVPEDAKPGTYRTSITVSTGTEPELEIPVSIRIRGYQLDRSGPKRLGIYYYFEEKLFDEEQILRELADLRSHGIEHLSTDLEIQHSPADGSYEANVEMARRGLEMIRQAGFRHIVVIQNGLVRVKKWRAREFEGGVSEDPVFSAVVDRTMKEIDRLAREFPELEIYQTHLDEVFSRGTALDDYIDMTKHIQRTSKVPLYITFNTRTEENEARRLRLDPFMNLRGYHGFSFEWWISRGHRVEEMERELKASGDRALFYHNARGPYFTPERSRLVNGLILWAWPFESHAPWIYQMYAGNPFDDRDGDRHDFGMAFPGPDDTLVSTRLWEGTREGWIDLRHLQTLERLVEENAQTRPDAVRRARILLRSTRDLIREASPAPRFSPSTGSRNARGGLFLEKPTRTRSPEEAPLLTALEKELGSGGLDTLRHELARRIEELTP